MSTLLGALSRCLDRLAHPEVVVGGRPHPAFHVCGCVGLALATLLVALLALHRGLPLWTMAAVELVAVLTFLCLALATKVLTGRENLVYYYHEVLILLVSAALLRLVRQPVLPYLDATILGVGAFLACGRVGCLMAGCCHGRPSHWGVSYRIEHVAHGFPACYTGVRLFPVQLLESCWVAGTVLVGSYLVLGDYPSGTALVWYGASYGIGRFSFEFLRGDSERPCWAGYSEAQWISLLQAGGLLLAGCAGALPLAAWSAAALVTMLALIAANQLWSRYRGAAWPVLRPRHVRALAEIVRQAASAKVADSPGQVGLPAVDAASFPVLSTPLGIRLSLTDYDAGSERWRHIALSHRDGELPDEAVTALVRLMYLLLEVPPGRTVVRRSGRVVHLLVRA